MHPLVRDLYKRFLHVGKDYPKGYAYVREKAKQSIVNNKHMTSEDDIVKAVHKGRWWVNELIGVIRLKKYRAMRQRYGADASLQELERKLEEDLKVSSPVSTAQGQQNTSRQEMR
jgi:Complex 1 protein (LYR family)